MAVSLNEMRARAKPFLNDADRAAFLFERYAELITKENPPR